MYAIFWFGRALKASILLTPMIMTGPIAFWMKEERNFRKYWLKYLKWALGALGPCSIKFGQWAATRLDLFPEDLCRELSNLHTNCPEHSSKYSRKIIEESFGKRVSEIFPYFDDEPIASGAIAQVHHAKLKSGIDVAVKIRHPSVDIQIKQDLHTLKFFGSIKNFSQSLSEQLDLYTEAQNLETFNNNFKDFPNICFPTAYMEYCSEKMLVESFEEGTLIAEFMGYDTVTKLKKTPKEFEDGVVPRTEEIKHQLATLGFNAFLKMIFIDHFIHADLHPGNILVRNRNGNVQIVLLDVGLITTLTGNDRENFLDLFSSVAFGNGRRGAELMVERSRMSGDCTDELKDRFVNEMNQIFLEVSQLSVKEIHFAHYIMRVLILCRECYVQLDGNFTSLMAGLIVIEGLARQLQGDFDLLQEAKPLLIQDPSLMNNYLKKKIKNLFSS
eukprot:TRINITY_DN7108_c0_g1_i1.p1 TRINITY_DN7108_c0_g1~~TRINITY_DN7108_c0_g1_i1.p1  ORF type:complete len:443 (+),score=127.33 TRINITY_DN7108_c0_g1_i1:125-1453(+)